MKTIQSNFKKISTFICIMIPNQFIEKYFKPCSSAYNVTPKNSESKLDNIAAV